MKVAVIFNPLAGSKEKFHKIGSDLNEKFKDCQIVTGNEVYGKEYTNTFKSFELSEGTFLDKIRGLINTFIDEKPDFIIGVGGDGLLSHISSILIERKSAIPIMGIAGGTANVGPLIRFNSKSIKELNLKKLKTEKVSAIRISDQNNESCYAFIDIVVGDTFLGTINGIMSNISIKAFKESGIKTSKKPDESLKQEKYKIIKNNLEIKNLINASQIVISPIYKSEFYMGKACASSLCIANYYKKEAVITLTNKIFIDSGEIDTESPSLTQQILFGENEIIKINSISSNFYYVVDGNPSWNLSEEVYIEYKKDIIETVIPENENILPVSNY